jgi:hypothetical protein
VRRAGRSPAPRLRAIPRDQARIRFMAVCHQPVVRLGIQLGQCGTARDHHPHGELDIAAVFRPLTFSHQELTQGGWVAPSQCVVQALAKGPRVASVGACHTALLPGALLMLHSFPPFYDR